MFVDRGSIRHDFSTVINSFQSKHMYSFRIILIYFLKNSTLDINEF